MRNFWKAALGAAAVAVAATAASAQTQPAPIGIEMEHWRFTPLVSTQNNNTVWVQGFLGLLDPMQAVGSNITAIWYERAEDGSWSASAWTAEAEWNAVEAVKASFNLNAQSDPDWFTWEAAPEEAAPSEQEPAAYWAGFLEGDEMAEAAEDGATRDELVSSLVAVGYPAADVLFERAAAIEPCTAVAALDAMAYGVEAEMNAAADGEEEAAKALAQSCAVCLPWTWYSTPTAWTCGAWGAYGAPVQSQRITMGGTQVWCCYTSTRTCTRTRTKTVRHLDCTRTVTTQTQTRTDSHEVCCDDTGTLTNPGAPPDPCTGSATCFNSTTPPPAGTPPTTPGNPGGWV